jgi:hypothetical protein
MSRPIVVIAAFALVICAGCATTQHQSSQQSRSAVEGDDHALTAGIAMTNKPYEEPASTAVFRVVGHVTDTTIEALSVTGTTWRGSAVLRVTVAFDSQLPQPDRTVRCYRYLFDRSSVNDARPKRLPECPDSEAVVLSSPPSGPDLSARASSKLASRLSALATDQRTARVVSALLTGLYPDPVTSAAEQSGSTTVTFRVNYENACLLGQLSIRGAAHVVSATGTDCRGG